MSQSKLTAFTEDAPEPAKKAYNCWTCILKRNITIVEGRQKVQCKGGSGLRDFRETCSSWTDGKDLEEMLKFAPPPGHAVKKWARQ